MQQQVILTLDEPQKKTAVTLIPDEAEEATPFGGQGNVGMPSVGSARPETKNLIMGGLQKAIGPYERVIEAGAKKINPNYWKQLFTRSGELKENLDKWWERIKEFKPRETIQPTTFETTAKKLIPRALAIMAGKPELAFGRGPKITTKEIGQIGKEAVGAAGLDVAKLLRDLYYDPVNTIITNPGEVITLSTMSIAGAGLNKLGNSLKSGKMPPPKEILAATKELQFMELPGELAERMAPEVESMAAPYRELASRELQKLRELGTPVKAKTYKDILVEQRATGKRYGAMEKPSKPVPMTTMAGIEELNIAPGQKQGPILEMKGLNLRYVDKGGKPITYDEFLNQNRPQPPQVISEKSPILDKNIPYTFPTQKALTYKQLLAGQTIDDAYGPFQIAKQNNQGQMPVYKHEFEAVHEIKDMPSTGMEYAFTNPIRIFDKYPVLKSAVYDPMKVAEKNITLRGKAIEAEVGAYKKTPGFNNRKVGDYAIAMQEGGEESLGLMGRMKPELNPAELGVYDSVRNNLKTVFTEINQARRLSGLEPVPEVRNYFTFIRNLDELEKLGFNILKERDVDLLKVKLNAPAFRYATPRSGIILPVENDFLGIYRNYMDSAIRHIEKGPVIAKGRELIGDYKLDIGGRPGTWSFKENNPVLYNQMTKWLDFQSGVRPPGFLPPTIQKFARKLSGNIFMAILDFNVRSALIQPSSLRNAYIEIGPKYLSSGMIDNLSPAMRKFALEKSNVLMPREFEATLVDVMRPGASRAATAVRRGVSTVGIAPLKFLDMESARTTWLGAYKRAITSKEKGGLGFVEKDAFKYADDTVTRTQASASPSDIAPIQRTPEGRLLTSMQTFVINEYNFLKSDVLGIGKLGKPLTGGQLAHNAMRLLLSTVVINYLFEDIFNLRSPFPAPEQVIKEGIKRGDKWSKIAVDSVKELAEPLPVVGGAIRWSTANRPSLPIPLQMISDLSTSTAKMLSMMSGKGGEINRRDLEFIGRVFGIPGTAEAAKFVTRIKAGMSIPEALAGVKTPEKPPSKKTELKSREIFR